MTKKPEHHWNHRVVVTRNPKAALPDERVMFGIHEVYYTNGKPNGFTSNPVPIQECSMKELRETALRVLRATRFPALELKRGKLIQHRGRRAACGRKNKKET